MSDEAYLLHGTETAFQASEHRPSVSAPGSDDRPSKLTGRPRNSPAMIWQQQGGPAESHDLLLPEYSWFGEGFDTPDLIEAKALLDELV